MSFLLINFTHYFNTAQFKTVLEKKLFHVNVGDDRNARVSFKPMYSDQYLDEYQSHGYNVQVQSNGYVDELILPVYV